MNVKLCSHSLRQSSRSSKFKIQGSVMTAGHSLDADIKQTSAYSYHLGKEAHRLPKKILFLDTMLLTTLLGIMKYVHNTFKEDVTTVRKPLRLADGVSVPDKHAAQR